MFRRLLTLWLFFLGLLMAVPASAADSAAAEALFRSAREAADRGDWVTACDRFEESKRLEPAPGTVLNLARCREHLGQIASAWKSYEEAAQRLPRSDERAAFARRRARELSERVPRLLLIAPETSEEFVVRVSGTELSSASFGVPLPYDPGKVNVVVLCKGYQENVVEVELVEGETIEHQLELGLVLGASGDSPSDEMSPVADGAGDPKGGASRTWGKISLVAGGVGVAVAGASAVWAAVELPTVKGNCQDGRCNQEGADAAARGRTAVILLGAGSAAALLGVGLGSYLLLRPAESTQVGFSPLLGGGILSLRHSL